VGSKAGRPRNSINIVDADIPSSGFALAKIRLADVNLFAQFSLAEAGKLPGSLDVVPDSLTNAVFGGFVFAARHAVLGQESVTNVKVPVGEPSRCHVTADLSVLMPERRSASSATIRFYSAVQTIKLPAGCGSGEEFFWAYPFERSAK
jgi:hypothetical protein